MDKRILIIGALVLGFLVLFPVLAKVKSGGNATSSGSGSSVGAPISPERFQSALKAVGVNMECQQDKGIQKRTQNLRSRSDEYARIMLKRIEQYDIRDTLYFNVLYDDPAKARKGYVAPGFEFGNIFMFGSPDDAKRYLQDSESEAFKQEDLRMRQLLSERSGKPLGSYEPNPATTRTVRNGNVIIFVSDSNIERREKIVGVFESL